MRKSSFVSSFRYGSRKSGKLVRCYWKEELGVYRVEVELHSSLLRSKDISILDDLPAIVDLIYPKHVRFVEFNWAKLKPYLIRKIGCNGKDVFSEARRRSTSIQRVAHYLRRQGIANIHRFLFSLEMNESVECALQAWARRLIERRDG